MTCTICVGRDRSWPRLDCDSSTKDFGDGDNGYKETAVLVTIKAWSNKQQSVYECLVDTAKVSKCTPIYSEKVPIGGGCLVMHDGHVTLLASYEGTAMVLRIGQNYDAGMGCDGRHITQPPVEVKKKVVRHRRPSKKLRQERIRQLMDELQACFCDDGRGDPECEKCQAIRAELKQLEEA